MNIENKFNLVDEKWIPIVGKGRVSLRQIFSDTTLQELGGNPIQKISLIKFLLAISQSSYTPKDECDLKNLGIDGMSKKVLEYLDKNSDLFFLYGLHPFLQVPQIKNVIEERKIDLSLKIKDPKKLEIEIEKILPKQIGNGNFPNLPANNNTILTQHEFATNIDDADKALFLLTLMSFSFAGKQVDNSISINPIIKKKPVAKVGPSLGRACYLHTYVFTSNLQETIFINLLTEEIISSLFNLPYGLGVAPWEKMPTSETCDVGKKLKGSYLGLLVPISRFALYSECGIYYTEGIQFPNHKEGWKELTMATSQSSQGVRVLQAKTDKKPWRELSALLSYISSEKEFDCPQLKIGINRIRDLSIELFKIWSGGLDVSGDSFGQKIKEDNDYVESEISLETSILGESWYSRLKMEMGTLEEMSNVLTKAVDRFYRRLGIVDKKFQLKSKTMFWQLIETKFNKLVMSCDKNSDEERIELRRIFALYAEQVYDFCSLKDTARQIEAWAICRPKMNRFLAISQIQKEKV